MVMFVTHSQVAGSRLECSHSLELYNILVASSQMKIEPEYKFSDRKGGCRYGLIYMSSGYHLPSLSVF